MAVFEIQFQEQVFFQIIAAQVVRTDPPGILLAQLPAGALIDRIETGAVEFAAGDILAGDDELAVRVPLTVHVTSLEGAKTAGSLQRPVTVPQDCTIWLRLQPAPPLPHSPREDEREWGIQFLLARVEVGGNFIPVFPPPPPRRIALGGLGQTVVSLALGQGDGVVSIRFFTRSQTAVPGPITSRIGTADWGQFIEGQVFADALADELNTAADDAEKAPSDPAIEKDTVAVGHWDGSIPAAHSSVELTAVHAIPPGISVPITIYATTKFQVDPVLDRIELQTRISWAAHDFITVVSSGAIEIVEDEVSAGMLDKLKPKPGQEEVERGDRHVVFRMYRPFVEPITDLFSATVDAHSITAEGVGATGPVNVYPAPVAHFTLEEQHWESGVNCNARRWQTKYIPPRVNIFGVDRSYGLRFVTSVPVSVDPAGFWVPQFSWSGVSPGNMIAHVSFEPPPGADHAARVNKSSSGFIVTNLGVRWVDLGKVPARPPEPADPTGIQVYVYTKCMKLIDPWGMGVLNLDWLVDPPDLDLGMPPLREWTLTGTQILEASEVELIAVGPGGERPLGKIAVEHNAVLGQVITEADETLQVRSNGPLAPTPPEVLQRWIVPWSWTHVGEQVRELAFANNKLFVIEDGAVRSMELVGSGQPVPMREEEIAELPSKVAKILRGLTDGMPNRFPMTAGASRNVAVVHNGDAIVGFAGPYVRATEGLVKEEQAMT
jgi:hypothetical protein